MPHPREKAYQTTRDNTSDNISLGAALPSADAGDVTAIAHVIVRHKQFTGKSPIFFRKKLTQEHQPNM